MATIINYFLLVVLVASCLAAPRSPGERARRHYDGGLGGYGGGLGGFGHHPGGHGYGGLHGAHIGGSQSYSKSSASASSSSGGGFLHG